MPLFLYHGKTSTCSSRVRLALAEHKLDFDGTFLDLRKGEQRSAEYLALNPNGVVPTLLVDGEPVIESSLILELIDDLGTGPSLMPEAPVARAHVRLWLRKVDEDLHHAAMVLTYALAMRRGWLQRPVEDLARMLAGIADENMRETRRSLLLEGVESHFAVDAAKSARRFIAGLDKAVAKEGYAVGAGVTLADIGAVSYIQRLEALGLDWLWADHEAVVRWWATMRARESFKVALLDYMSEADHARYGGFEAECARLKELVAG